MPADPDRSLVLTLGVINVTSLVTTVTVRVLSKACYKHKLTRLRMQTVLVALQVPSGRPGPGVGERGLVLPLLAPVAGRRGGNPRKRTTIATMTIWTSEHCDSSVHVYYHITSTTGRSGQDAFCLGPSCTSLTLLPCIMLPILHYNNCST